MNWVSTLLKWLLHVASVLMINELRSEPLRSGRAISKVRAGDQLRCALKGHSQVSPGHRPGKQETTTHREP